MMRSKECVAMLLAGGQGNRLGVITKDLAKPAVPFGGKYRIIDFTLSNCTNSGIDTVGVLTQYRPLRLNTYLGIGQSWDLDRMDGGVAVLPPYQRGKKLEFYKGTANAISQNIEFIEQYQPEYVLILSGDHIYTMDYSLMIDYHKKNNADATIAAIDVPIEEASRFGIMNTNENGRIYEFEEKPKKPKSTKASMGIYVFNWKLLRKYLREDDEDPKSGHDFGKNVLPKMLSNGEKLVAYSFKGYWKDVGTLKSLWEANMDILEYNPKMDLNDPKWRIYSKNPIMPPHYIANGAKVRNCLIAEGCMIYGSIDHSVIFTNVRVGSSSEVIDSIIMPNVKIGKNVKIKNSIIAEGVVIEDNCIIGFSDSDTSDEHTRSLCEGLSIIGEHIKIAADSVIELNVMVDENMDYAESISISEFTGKEDGAI
jgi:glucose-1-phosphate adenylyltransferase